MSFWQFGDQQANVADVARLVTAHVGEDEMRGKVVLLLSEPQTQEAADAIANHGAAIAEEVLSEAPDAALLLGNPDLVVAEIKARLSRDLAIDEVRVEALHVVGDLGLTSRRRRTSDHARVPSTQKLHSGSTHPAAFDHEAATLSPAEVRRSTRPPEPPAWLRRPPIEEAPETLDPPGFEAPDSEAPSAHRPASMPPSSLLAEEPTPVFTTRKPPAAQPAPSPRAAAAPEAPAQAASKRVTTMRSADIEEALEAPSSPRERGVQVVDAPPLAAEPEGKSDERKRRTSTAPGEVLRAESEAPAEEPGAHLVPLVRDVAALLLLASLRGHDLVYVRELPGDRAAVKLLASLASRTELAEGGHELAQRTEVDYWRSVLGEETIAGVKRETCVAAACLAYGTLIDASVEQNVAVGIVESLSARAFPGESVGAQLGRYLFGLEPTLHGELARNVAEIFDPSSDPAPLAQALSPVVEKMQSDLEIAASEVKSRLWS